MPVANSSKGRKGGYARLKGSSFDCVLRSKKAVLGRGKGTREGGSGEPTFISLGTDLRLDAEHLTVEYDSQSGEFRLRCEGAAGVRVNGKVIAPSDSTRLCSQDRVSIPGVPGSQFHFLLPRGARGESKGHSKRPDSKKRANGEGAPSSSARGGSDTSGAAASALPASKQGGLSKKPNGGSSSSSRKRKRKSKAAGHKRWSAAERERFQRVLLTFGFPRAPLVKTNANLTQRTEAAVAQYTRAFVERLVGMISGENQEYLKRAARETGVELAPSTDPTAPHNATAVPPSLQNWPKMTRSANQWSHRLCNLHFLGRIVCGGDKVDPLRFIPPSFFSGPKPTSWWGRNDDRALLRGTFKFGYARYDDIKSAQDLGFTSPEAKARFRDKPGAATTTNGWPSSDVLTRRLKRLLGISMKQWRAKGSLGFWGMDLMFSDETAPGALESALKRRLRHPAMDATAAAAYLSRRSRKTRSRAWLPEERRAVERALLRHAVRVRADGSVDVDAVYAASGLQSRCGAHDVAVLVTCILGELCLFERDRAAQQPWDPRKTAPGGNPMGPFGLPPLRWRTRDLEELARRVPALRSIATAAARPGLGAALRENKCPPLGSDSGLPGWWRPVDDDARLIRGIAKHGFGQWANVFSDQTLRWGCDTSATDGTPARRDQATTKSPLFVVDIPQSLPQAELGTVVAAPSPAPTGEAAQRRLAALLPVLTSAIETEPKTDSEPFLKLIESYLVLPAPLSDESDDKALVGSTERAAGVGSSSSSVPQRSLAKRKARQALQQARELPFSVFSAPLLVALRPTEFDPRNTIALAYRGADGKLQLPMRLTDDLCLYSFGGSIPGAVLPPTQAETQLCARFHSAECLFRPGYVAVRQHQSMVNPDHACLYKCEIARRGDRPVFVVTCADAPNDPVEASHPDDAWQRVSDRIHLISSAPLSERSRRINGCERFGLLHETVVALNQDTLDHIACQGYEPVAAAYTNFVH